MFIHFHEEWFVNCSSQLLWQIKFSREENRELKLSRRSLQYSSIHIWLELLRKQTLSQYVITGILVESKEFLEANRSLIRAPSTIVNDVGFSMLAVMLKLKFIENQLMTLDANYFRKIWLYVFAANSNTIKIKLEFMYMCVRGTFFARVSTMLRPVWVRGSTKRPTAHSCLS